MNNRDKFESFKHEPIGLLKITCPVNVGLQIVVPAINKLKKISENKAGCDAN
jgi:hypothetical protein